MGNRQPPAGVLVGPPLTLAEAHGRAPAAVLHAAEPLTLVAPRSGPQPGSCARCGGPTSTRLGARYCSAACRLAAVRERRADARADLLVALDQLVEVARRVETALRTLGLNPQRPRAQEPPCQKKP